MQREYDKVRLKVDLRALNTEWRVLTREKSKGTAKLVRMDELRERRLKLMTALFDIDRREGTTLL